PGIAEALEDDLRNAGMIVRLSRALAPGLDAKAVAEELRVRVLEELDYEYEAQSQRTFSRAYRDHPFIYVPDVLTRLSRRRVKVIESTSDPRSEYYSLMRRENLPAEELMGRRMETGVLAVLAQLQAKRNWHRISREWIYGDEPATPLGVQEWDYFESRGQIRTPGIASRP